MRIFWEWKPYILDCVSGNLPVTVSYVEVETVAVLFAWQRGDPLMNELKEREKEKKGKKKREKSGEDTKIKGEFMLKQLNAI